MSISDKQQEELWTLLKRTGELLLRHWKRPREGVDALQVFTKPDGTKVTEADLEANELLVEGLRQIFPGIGIVSEESEVTPDLREMKEVIIADPLDGTRSFIAQKDDFSVLVGYSQNEVIQWGAMHFPAKNISAIGLRGRGAVIEGVVAKVSNEEKLRPKTVFLSKCELSGSELPISEWMDSGMALLALAKGELLGVIIKMETHQEWDIAAPEVILREAGGVMTDELGQEVRFNQPRIGFRYLVASNGKAHGELLRLVERIDQGL